MSADNGSGDGGIVPGPQPRIQVIGQYVKDLSFENPGAPAAITQRPNIDLGVDLQARRMDAEHFEVELELRVTATADEKPVFLLELMPAGVCAVRHHPPARLE